ncbi:cystathionine beta-lyase family protein involved in aluminum resistance [Amphibacillus cookii]|nr:cystathionine beta-lyase family protein involved in aluminum resistance [Amphibacillus cookii]
MDFGVNYHAIPLTNTNEIDLLNKSINEQTKMIAISDQKDMPTLLHSQCGYIKI